VLLVNAGFTGLAEVGLGEPIPIVLAAPATPAEQIAARALRRCLNPDGVFLLGRAASAQGCIKLRFSGWGQLVPGIVGLELRGQAVPAPFRRAFEPELDAALASAPEGEQELDTEPAKA
jgi:hypothetical protein